MWLNFFRASSISRHILPVTDSTSVGPPLEVALTPEDCWRKSHETDASRTGTSSGSVKGSKTLLVGVGCISDTDDIEERDVDGEPTTGDWHKRLVRQLLEIAVIAIVGVVIRIIDGIDRQFGILKMDGIPSLAFSRKGRRHRTQIL